VDIYSAEVQVKKLLNYVNELSNSKPRMYQKSKDRLKELANTCNQVILVIAEILQDEALINGQEDEFGGSQVSDLDSVLDSMEDQISELRQFLSSPKPVSNVNTNFSTSKKRALFTYKHCLSTLANADVAILEAGSCGKLLWKWFSTRFLECPESFKYNMKKLPRWIRDIVILYGYNLECGTLNEFTTMFDKWMLSITTSENNYAVPYEVYEFDKTTDPCNMTLSAVVIWDILLDYGLRDLCCDPSSELYPSEDCVYSLVSSKNGEIMNPYTNYLYDKSILDICNLTLKAGDSE